MEIHGSPGAIPGEGPPPVPVHHHHPHPHDHDHEHAGHDHAGHDAVHVTMAPGVAEAAAAPADAGGRAMLAAGLLFLAGAFQIAIGFAGVAESDYLRPDQDWPFALNPTAWGWIHIAIGIALLVASGLVAKAHPAGRPLGLVLAVTGALGAFLWLPYAATWAVLVVALDVVVIWALTTRPPRAPAV